MKARREELHSLFEKGDFRGAERRCKAILRKRPRHPEALHVLACIRMRGAKVEAAARLIKRAIDTAPVVPEYHETLAEVHYRSGRLEAADAECRLALRLEAKRPRALHLLGKIATDRCDYPRAIEFLTAALATPPPNVDVMLDLSVALNRVGENQMAANYCQLVLKLIPDHPAALINLGMAHKAVNRLSDAKTAFATAGDHPMARFNLGYVQLLEDDLERGLPLLEERKKLLGTGKGLAGREWEGDLQSGGTLLVIHEQGFGDTILMSRFYPMLLDAFERVVVHVQEPMARLIATVSPDVEIVTATDGIGYDAWCATMSLPLRLGIDSVDKIPNRPWLHVPRSTGESDRLRIGLNWAGNPSFAYDAVRSTTLQGLQMFLQVPDVEWVSLHKGHLEHEAEEFGLPQPLQDAGDFYDTASVIQNLDLVISTETAIPNLSAALGVRTCVLTGPAPDWRWKSWYPNVTICRQETVGNWFGAIAAALEVIREELERRPEQG